MAESRIFHDTFTDTNGTTLASHTPDTGTGYTLIDSNGGETLEIQSNQAVANQQGFSEGATYTADVSSPGADTQLVVDSYSESSSDDYTTIGVRANSDIDGYFFEYYSDDAYDPVLYKVVNSSWTSLYTLDNGEGSAASGHFPNSSQIILQALGSEITVYGGNANETNPEAGKVHVTNSDITAAGEGVISLGALRDTGGDTTNVHKFDNLEVWDLGANTAGWNAPSTNGEISSDATNPTNAYTDDTNSATLAGSGTKHDYGDFGFSIPAEATIRGIMVKVDAESYSPGTRWVRYGVEVSNDNGSTWSAQKLCEVTLANHPQVVGHARSLWGLSWTNSDLNDSDFRIRIENVTGESPTRDMELYFVAVKVVYDSASGTNDNDERSAKITGKDTTSSTRDAKVTGKSTASDTRDAKVTGSTTTNDTRDAKITGTDTTADIKDAKITGSLTANDTRDAKITGQATASDTRDAKITGTATDSDTRNAKVTGVEGANDTRDAKITGTATTNDVRDAKVTGSQTDNDARDAKITGKTTASDTRDAKITGTDTTNDTRNAKVTGSTTANSTRDAKITGVTASNYTKEAKATLPTDDTNLATSFTSQEETDVSTDDDVFVDLTGQNAYNIFQFKVQNDNNSDYIDVTSKVKTDMPTTSSPAKLEIYNQNSATWELVDSNNTFGSGSEFQLSGVVAQGGTPSDYYDGSNYVSFRIYQDVS